MKRTFTFTIESEEDHDTNAAHVRDLLEAAWFVRSADVTETTAVHAKQMEVIEAVLEYQKRDAACEANKCASDDFLLSKEADDAIAMVWVVGRELRALMEGKA